MPSKTSASSSTTARSSRWMSCTARGSSAARRTAGGRASGAAGLGRRPVRPPAITLPKGGGAIRGIGEKFAANPVTGTGSMSVPIATSPGRSGFGPQLSLSYDSGRRQRPVRLRLEPFASVDHPQDRQGPAAVPRRRGVGRLHPLRRRGPGAGVPAGPDGLGRHPGYATRRLGARSGRWSSTKTNSTATASAATGRASKGCSRASSAGRKIGAPGDVHWRSISKDNILTLYGTTPNSRIADPAGRRAASSAG